VLKTVKIDKRLYDTIKALAKKRGQFLSFHLNQAVRQYLLDEQVVEQLQRQVKANG